MHWHIQGAGSLGCLWAARLAAAQQSVQLILRTPTALANYEKIGQVRITDAQQKSHSYPIKAQLATQHEPIENLLLACKAYDAEAAIAQVAHRLSKNSLILLLQNGLGSQQAVQSLLPEQQCIAASSTEGAYLAAPFHTIFAGQGTVYLGSLTARSEPAGLVAACQAAKIPCFWTEQIATTLWRKLAINCAINPLSVIHDCNNGALRQHSSTVNQLCDELQRLLQAAQQADAAEQLHQQVWQVIEKTAANSSSMRQDVRHLRRTEISYMTGFACQQSLSLGCSTPMLHALHAQLEHVLIAQGLAHS